MEECYYPLQTLMAWVVAVDVRIEVCYGWKEALKNTGVYDAFSLYMYSVF